MPERRRKRLWHRFFGATVNIPALLAYAFIFGFFAYMGATRVCTFSRQGAGKYCSWDQLASWFSVQGGWWKLLICAALFGLLAIPDWDSDLRKGNEKRMPVDKSPDG